MFEFDSGIVCCELPVHLLLPQINVQFDCWLSNLFCHFLDFTDY